MIFLQSAYRLTRWLGVIGVPLAALACGPRVALGLFSGLLWSVMNAWVIERLMQGLTSAQRQSPMKIAVLWMVKVPLLYGACVFLIVSPGSSPIAFLVGFSLWFVSLMMSAIRAVAL